MKLKEICKKMWKAMENNDKPDEYLETFGFNTRKDIAFTEISEGISVVPCDMVYPFLYALATDEQLSDIVKEIENDPESYLGSME